MAREGSYGWSPEQMERINARRAARGREQLVNRNNPQYYQEDEEEPVRNRQQSSSQRPSALDQYKGQKSLSERIASRGSLKDELQDRSRASQVGRAVESEDEKRKRNRGMGISTPSLQSSFNRFTA